MVGEPTQPPQTCPAINSIQKDCDKGEHLASDIMDLFASIHREIEELREQNEQLREFGDFYFERCQELERQMVRLEADAEEKAA